MKDIKVSVIIPIYNAEKYLEESLNGVLNQTLKDIEIICVDDGSTDSSLDILEHYAEKDDRILILCQEHSNAGKARNKGLEMAKGKYLSFLDADDIYEPDMLEEVYKQAENNKAELVIFRSNRYNTLTRFYEDSSWTIHEENIPKIDCFSCTEVNDLFNSFSGFPWDKLYNREYVFESGVRFQEQLWINDRAFVEMMLALAKRISIVDRTLIHKRINHNEALSTRYVSNDNWQCWFNALDSIKNNLIEKGKYKELERDYLNLVFVSVIDNLDIYMSSEGFDGLYEYAKLYIKRLLGDDSLIHRMVYQEDIAELIERLLLVRGNEYKWKRSIDIKKDEYLFPFDMVPRGAKIVLYGAGTVGRMYFRQIKRTKWCRIVAWVDSNSEGYGDEVVPPENGLREDYELIVIALSNEKGIVEVKQYIDSMGAGNHRIIYR